MDLSSPLLTLCLGLSLLSEKNNVLVTSLGSVSVVNSRISNMKDSVDVVTVMSGDSAQLPCPTLHPPGPDRVKLVLWFRNTSDTPFYTFDAVSATAPPQHWRDQDVAISIRSQFLLDPSPSSLTIKELDSNTLSLGDSGRYRCRVDYFLEQTTFHLIDLVVVVPPDRPNIFIENGLPVNTRYTARLNSAFLLKCQALGGFPPPALQWWKNNELVDSSYQRQEDRVENVVQIDNLTRDDVKSVLSCRAVNNNISSPVQTTVHLDIILPPLSVTILDKSRQPVSGQNRTVVCRVVGSSPTPTVTWTRNGYDIRGASIQSSVEGNVTLSRITISPTLSSSHLTNKLTCRAQTPGLATTLSDSWNYTVHYSPMVSIKLGDSLNKSNIKEGDDVYFECKVQASPRAQSIVWYHNGRVIYQDKNGGIIITGNSLAVQNIQRHNEGDYSCLASNDVGTTESQSINLNIKYRPVCRPGTKRVYEANKLQVVNIDCNVLSNPRESLLFSWSFNNSINSMDIPPGQISVTSEGSSLRYSPRTELDYGTLLCWATNNIGRGDPCVFTILPIGPPEPPAKCRTSNVTYSSFEISCSLISSSPTTLYSLEVTRVGWDQVRTLQSTVAQWAVGGLQSGTTYKVNVRCENKHGRSDPLYLLIETLNEPIKQIAETKVKEEAGDYNQMLAITIGVMVSLIIMVVMVVIAVFTIRCPTRLRTDLSRSDSDMRLTNPPRVGYCTTISSDIEEFARDGSGYHPLSSKQRPEKLIVKNGETYLPCPSSCDSSCVLPEGDSPDTRNGISQLDKVLHTPPPQYRGSSDEAPVTIPFESRC